MITGRGLGVGAVGSELGFDLGGKFAGGELNPSIGLRTRREICRCEEQPGNAGQIMIAAVSRRGIRG